MPCCLSRGEAERGGERGSEAAVLEGGGASVPETELGTEVGALLLLWLLLPLLLLVKLGFLLPAPPSVPGGVRTESGMVTCRLVCCGDGKSSWAAGGLVMLYGDSLREISRLGG